MFYNDLSGFLVLSNSTGDLESVGLYANFHLEAHLQSVHREDVHQEGSLGFWFVN